MNKTLIIFEMIPDSSIAYPVEVTDIELNELKNINGLVMNCSKMTEEQEKISLKWQERLTDIPSVRGSLTYDGKTDGQIDLPWAIEHVIFVGFAL